MSGPTATIDRLECTYLVPGDHPDVARVAFTLDAVARDRLASASARALAALLDPADPAVWVIRRLDVGVLLPAGGGPADDLDVLARQWAEGIAARIAGVVRGVVQLPAGDVVRYPDRVAYLAAFAYDLAWGRAWDDGGYAMFAGLREVPAGQALVTAAAKLDVALATVVGRLGATGRLAPLLVRFAADDAAALWRACRMESQAEPPVAGAVEQVLAWLPTAAAAGGGRAVVALRVLGAALAATGSGQPAAPMVAAVDRVIQAMPPDDGRAGSATAAAPRHRPTSPAQAAVAGALAADAGPTGSVWHPSVAPAGPVTPVDLGIRSTTTFASFASAHAGVLRLVPALLEVGLNGLAAPLRHRVLLRCAGWQAAATAAGDPALRTVAGLEPGEEPDMSTVDISGLDIALSDDLPDIDFLGVGDGGPLDRVATAVAQAGIRRFAGGLIGFARASAAHLFENVYSVAGVVTVQPGSVSVALEPCPLQVVLIIGGIDRVTCPLPWLDADLVLRTAGG